MCIFQLDILPVPVDVMCQIQSHNNYTVCIICSSFTLIQSDGEQMQHVSFDQLFPVLKGPCEIASSSHFQMVVQRFR